MLDINVSGLTQTFGYRPIFDNAEFHVNSGEKVAIVGENGSGKSTIFRLIQKEETPTKGLVAIRNNATVGYLPQGLPVVEEGTSVREFLSDAFGVGAVRASMRKLEAAMCNPNTSAEMMEKVMAQYGNLQTTFENSGGYAIDSEIDKVAANMGLTDFVEQDFNSLSPGQKTIVSLCQVMLKKPDILLLDEPTNHLDIQALNWLEAFVKGFPGSVVMVSHDRYFLDRTVDKIFAIDGAKVKTYFGDYTHYAQEAAAERAIQQQAYVTQQKEIAGIEDSIRKNRAWGAASGEKAYRKAKQLERTLDQMDKVEKPTEQRDIALNFNQQSRSGNDVLKIEEGLFSYDGSNLILCGANLELHYKDRVCLVGENGCGKSTILGVVLGALPLEAGAVTLGSNVKIGYLPQEIKFENENATVLEEFQKHSTGTITQAYNRLAGFRFFGEEVKKRLKDLSGGERVRLKFAELVQSDVNFLILDEPTNHLDIRNREVLEEALNAFGGTVLMVSHDRYFINQVATRIEELSEGTLTTYDGDYDYYLEKKSGGQTPLSQGSQSGPQKVLRREEKKNALR